MCVLHCTINLQLLVWQNIREYIKMMEDEFKSSCNQSVLLFP